MMPLAIESREPAATPFDIRVAYHEAGHGVAALALDVPFRFIAVQPTPTSSGRLQFTRSLGDVDMEKLVLIKLAGTAAEEYFSPLVRHGVQRLNGNDLKGARI